MCTRPNFEIPLFKKIIASDYLPHAYAASPSLSLSRSRQTMHVFSAAAAAAATFDFQMGLQEIEERHSILVEENVLVTSQAIASRSKVL